MERNLAAWIQTVEVRHVAMVNFRSLQVPIFEPLLKLSGAANLIGYQPRPGGRQLLAKSVVRAKDFRSLDTVAEQIPQNLHVHRWTGAHGGTMRMLLFWSKPWTGHQPFMRRLFHQGIKEKLRRAFHERISRHEKILVPAEFVMFPQMQTQPGSPHRPHPPSWSVDRSRCAP